MKKSIIVSLLLLSTMGLYAQSGTNSPYSQYGLGELSDQSGSFNRGMNGLAYGLRLNNQINALNPASYSALDSLSFIFDAGVGLQMTQFKEGGRTVHAKNADLEYVVAGLRLFRHVGLSFGLLPYTNVGYDYSNSAHINSSLSPESPTATYSNNYHGSQGLHQVYLGLGVEPVRHLSVGFNVSYLWGGYTKTVTNSYSDAYVNTLQRIYSAEIRSYKLDFGLQYTLPFSAKDNLTLGLTYSLGHSLNASPELSVINNNSQLAVADTANFKISKALDVPHTFGAGLLYNHHDQLRIGVDYQLQKWGDLDYPQYSEQGGGYVLKSGLLKDRNKVTVGIDYCRGERYRGFLSRLHYRAGVGYATPYFTINGKDGPKELSASLGLGIPIINNYNNRSMLNISAQWVRRDATSMVTENTFRINIGFTFNERMFAKFKVE